MAEIYKNYIDGNWCDYPSGLSDKFAMSVWVPIIEGKLSLFAGLS